MIARIGHILEFDLNVSIKIFQDVFQKTSNMLGEKSWSLYLFFLGIDYSLFTSSLFTFTFL